MRLERAGEGDLAARLFGRDRGHAAELLRAAWPHAVGADLARRTEVIALEGHTLRVRVPDARWRTVLHRMQPQILGRLAGVAGSLAPRRLGFLEGAVVVPPAEHGAASEPSEPGPACPASLAAPAAAIADPEIRAGFLAAAGRYLARVGSRTER
jgi:hypothetical protein